MISRAHIRHKLENIQNLVPLGSVSRPGIDVAVGLTPEGGEGDGGDDELHEGKEDASVSVASILFEIKFVTHLEGSGVVDLSEEREKGFSLHSIRADAIRNSGKEEKNSPSRATQTKPLSAEFPASSSPRCRPSTRSIVRLECPSRRS